jgi:MYXO-CTERM domain-containing protein
MGTDSGPRDAGMDACTPAKRCPTGQLCGMADDGCGGQIACGTCQAPQTCGGGGTAGQCGCTKTTCAAAGAQCGALSDHCGGTLNCGTCAPFHLCNGQNQCVGGQGNDSGVPGDASADSGAGPAPGDNGGCGCRTAPSETAPPWALLGVGGFGLAAGLRLRRRRR